MRNPTICAEGPADEIGLHLWRYLPGIRQGRRARPAFLQYRHHGFAPRRNITRHRAPRARSRRMDQSAWHTTGKLEVPANISIVALPAKCPELNRSRGSGSSCVTTGSRIRCLPPTTTSWTAAARLGTGSSVSLGTSRPLGAARSSPGQFPCSMSDYNYTLSDSANSHLLIDAVVTA